MKFNSIKKKIFLIVFFIILILVSLVTIVRGVAKTEETLYSLDGREITISQDEVENYKNVGWYEEPVVFMYAIDGRTLIINQTEIEAYEKVGWYREPVTYMYSADGRTLIVKKSEIEIYKNLNWFLSKEEALFSMVDKRELELLARTIHAEAADNNYVDKCYTGMVIMNRKNSGIWGDTIYKVITAPGQYSSYNNSKFNSSIPSDCYEIAKQIMMGETFGVPYNVIFQSGAPQGKGIWKKVDNTSGYYDHYYCYGNI